MKTTILIIKGILFYITVITTVLFLCSIDSIYNNGGLLIALLIELPLLYICHETIKEDELKVISGCKFLENILKDKP